VVENLELMDVKTWERKAKLLWEWEKKNLELMEVWERKGNCLEGGRRSYWQ
jgi:hypothetical protein